jgi:N-acyl-D-aspartate/D-glutamate deacylase
MYDLIIKKATVVDGTGQPGFIADVGVLSGEVVDIAEDLSVKAKTIVDAQGLVLCPGFIDVQNHSDSYWCLFDTPGLCCWCLGPTPCISTYFFDLTISLYLKQLVR